jgi:hypothetical protein
MYLNEQARYDEAEAMYRLALSQTPQANWLAVDFADLERRNGDWRAG